MVHSIFTPLKHFIITITTWALSSFKPTKDYSPALGLGAKRNACQFRFGKIVPRKRAANWAAAC